MAEITNEQKLYVLLKQKLVSAFYWVGFSP